MPTQTGTTGNDFLEGTTGADTLIGLAGDDGYVVDHVNDVVTEAQNEGNDTVYASVSYTLTAGSYIENLRARDNSATTPLNLIGNEFSNLIFGNNGANFLDGGAGADIMTGFGGDDIYAIDNAGDVVDEGQNGGNDAIYTTFSYVLGFGASVEILAARDNSLTVGMNLFGNELNNIIFGNAGANFIDGGVGADIMTGFGGDDIYAIDNAGDVVDEGLNGGADTIYTNFSYVLGFGASVEILAARDNSSTATMNLFGNELDNFIFGNNGANFLDGQAGADTMTGFGGDDIYAIDNANDRVVEDPGGGNDAIYTTLSYVLAAGHSIETLAARDNSLTVALNLTGNELANTVMGNNGANVLDGGGGADVLFGFGGADSFSFTTTLGGGNVDTIIDFTTGLDKILLGGAVGQPFVTLATGTLRVGTLVIGTAAVDADDYLIYNSGTGALLFDADGNGAGAAVQFATLSAGLGLTVGDFVVSGLANNAPAVTSGGTASIAENSAASTIVYQATATDANGDRITWSLSGTDAGLLTIDANGAVRLINPANFEAKASYVFNVVANDSGSSTPRAVTLTVTDVAEASTPTINETAGVNDTRENAQSINTATLAVVDNPNLYNDDFPSATLVGNISTLGDVDFYSITLQAGQQLILDVDGTSGGLDAFLTLYGPTGLFIGDNDDQITFDPGSVPTLASHNTDSQIIFRAGTTGTYYFSIKSFEDDGDPTSTGGYLLHVSINNAPATPAQILAEDIEALISGAKWNDLDLTFGFPSAANLYPSDFEEVDTGPPAPAYTFEAFNATQMTATRALLGMIANVSKLTFTENTGGGDYTVAGSAASADLRFAESSAADVAYAYYPGNGGPDDVGGSAWFNRTQFNNPNKGNYAWMGILHETGHALGLKHGHEFPLAISGDHDSIEYSVMTYRSYPGQDLEDGGGYTNETWGYAQTLMMLDIAALQKIYGGANYTFNSGASTYSWSDTTGEMSINGVGQGAPGNGSASASMNRILMTIWDGGGNDTYDLSNYANGTTVDLRPGEWTTTSQTQIANLNGNGTGGPVYARGNIANALLYEGNTASAIENAKGGAGADILIANLVANQFTGNGGSDLFKWASTGDAGLGNLADTVLDFVRGTDKIDFTLLDAQPGTAGQQDFAFIGTGAFTNVAGQVRYEVTGGHAHIFADTDGNGTANMEIILNNITTLAATDFNF